MQKEASMYKSHRDDLEKKLQMQLSEMAAFQQSLYELECLHTQMKQRYEEEIRKLTALVDPEKKGPASAGPRGLAGPPPKLQEQVSPKGAFGTLKAPGAQPRSAEVQPELAKLGPNKGDSEKSPVRQLHPQGTPTGQTQPSWKKKDEASAQQQQQQYNQQQQQQHKRAEAPSAQRQPQKQPSPQTATFKKNVEDWALVPNPNNTPEQSGLSLELVHALDHGRFFYLTQRRMLRQILPRRPIPCYRQQSICSDIRDPFWSQSVCHEGRSRASYARLVHPLRVFLPRRALPRNGGRRQDCARMGYRT